MNWINHKALMKFVIASIMLLVCGYFVHPSIAAVGDSPLEAYFLPHDTEAILNNTRPPDELSSMSIGIQFDPAVLEPLGIINSGLTLEQWNTQMRYARTVNTISVSMNNFSTLKSGELLNLMFKVSPTATAKQTSPLTVSFSTLNGAIVAWADGMVSVTDY